MSTVCQNHFMKGGLLRWFIFQHLNLSAENNLNILKLFFFTVAEELMQFCFLLNNFCWVLQQKEKQQLEKNYWERDRMDQSPYVSIIGEYWCSKEVWRLIRTTRRRFCFQEERLVFCFEGEKRLPWANFHLIGLWACQWPVHFLAIRRATPTQLLTYLHVFTCILT